MVFLEKILGFFYFDFRDNFIIYLFVVIKWLVCKKIEIFMFIMYVYIYID